MNRIKEILYNIRPEEDFAVSDNFIEDGMLDSFDIVMLVTELDEAYSISIEGTDIVPENFRNIETIYNLLKKNGAVI